MNRRQTIPPQQKYTTKQFQAEFPNDDACLEYLMNKRFPGRMALCTKCKVERSHYRVSGRTCYACPVCGSQSSRWPEPSSISPRRPNHVVLRHQTDGSTRVGVSAKQIQRETGVTYKTAWRMMKQVRVLDGREDQTTGFGRDRRSLFRGFGQQ